MLRDASIMERADKERFSLLLGFVAEAEASGSFSFSPPPSQKNAPPPSSCGPSPNWVGRVPQHIVAEQEKQAEEMR